MHLDDPNVKALAEADPALALQGARPHVVDEWQEVPSTWDATRRAVDAAGGERGLFILTGSSTPAKDAVTHSGAGRIARVDMSTMTLWERGLSTGSVSLSGLFEGSFDPSACETSSACAKRSPPTRRPATPSPSFALLSPRRLPSAATTPPMMSTFSLSPLCGSKRSRRPECKQGRRCVRCDAAGCARVDVGGCRGFACGCPPVHVRLQSYIAAACAPDAW